VNFKVLYRGVNAEMYAATHGELCPKETKAFLKSPKFGLAQWGNAFWGENAENAVIEHQQHQVGHPTSGISTTPILERARFYATSGGKSPHGYVYIINVEVLASEGVTAYVVSDIVPMPSIPEDEEVILVANDFGALPKGIIIELTECRG
jgi:hypothetical protein